jgi:hypothetical protein
MMIPVEESFAAWRKDPKYRDERSGLGKFGEVRLTVCGGGCRREQISG